MPPDRQDTKCYRNIWFCRACKLQTGCVAKSVLLGRTVFAHHGRPVSRHLPELVRTYDLMAWCHPRHGSGFWWDHSRGHGLVAREVVGSNHLEENIIVFSLQFLMPRPGTHQFIYLLFALCIGFRAFQKKLDGAIHCVGGGWSGHGYKPLVPKRRGCEMQQCATDSHAWV